MAAPIKNFLICFKIIFDRSYRSLSSDISQEQYRDEFKLMGIPNLKGFVCHVCCNKLIPNCLHIRSFKVAILKSENESVLKGPF